MQRLPGFRLDDRAMSSTVSHALALAITTLLITGLVVGVGDYVDSETDRITRAELEALGARLADDVEMADRVTRDGGQATITSTLPAKIVDNEYTITLSRGAACQTGTTHSDTCLELSVPQRDLHVVQPLRNDSTIRIDREFESLRINATRGGSSSASGRDFELDVEPTVGVGRVSGAGGANPVVGNLDPIAGFVFSPGNPTAGDDITFRNDTDDLDGEIKQHRWTFEQPSGGTDSVTAPTTNYSYDVPGRYLVTLEVTDDDGDTDSVRRRVPISGLKYNEPAQAYDFDGDGNDGGLRFSMENDWSSEVKLLSVGVDPHHDGDQITGLDADNEWEYGGCDGPAEIRIESEPNDFGGIQSDDGYVKYCEVDLSISPDGTVANLAGLREDSVGDRAVVDAGDNVTFDLREFQNAGSPVPDARTYRYDIAVRYLVDGHVYVSKFTVFEPTTTSAVSWETASDWDDAPGQVNVTHPSDTVRLDAPGGSGLPDEDLVVWLPLNETGTPATATDYAGDHDFSVQGTPVRGVAGTGVGTAYRFTGDDWLVDSDADSQYFSSGFWGGEEDLTVSMWVKADQTGTDYGLIDTNPGSNVGALGLRYLASGSGTTDTFGSSVRVRQFFSSDEYEYEYESGVQSTSWQHVVLRWEDGEPVEVFVDGTELGTANGDGATDSGTHLDGYQMDDLAIGRSATSDAGDRWEGKIDEVRIYDRTLDDQEIEALATSGNLKEGSTMTEWKSTNEMLDLDELQLRYDVTQNGGTIKVTPYANKSGTIVEGDTITLNGNYGVREVRGLSGDADEFRLKIEFASTTGAPSASSFTLSE